MKSVLRTAGALLLAGTLFACGGGRTPAGPADPMASSAPSAGVPFSTPARTPLATARGVHMTSNFSDHFEAAFRQTIGTRLASGGALAAQAVSAQVMASAGGGVASELAQVRLTGLTLSDGTRLPSAGFWLGREPSTGKVFLQLRPSLDPNLSGVTGFREDVNAILMPDGVLHLSADTVAEGAALRLAADVLASAGTLLQSATVQLGAGTTFDKAQLVLAAQRVTAGVAAQRNAYFDRLRGMNADWVGISIALFVDSISDPTVRVRHRASGSAQPHEVATWADADLLAFMARAREQGIQVYLTLAFEQPGGDLPVPIGPADPRCNTPQAPFARYLMGHPSMSASHLASQCVAAADYWWAPAHPQHAAKKAAFWQSYTALAAHYAQIAQQGGAGLYSLGTETDWLFRTRTGANAANHFAPELQQMVAAVRAAYTGRVTYDQHIKAYTQPASLSGGEWAPHLAADLGFDVIGLSAYLDSYPAAPTQVLPVAELEANFWKPVFDNVVAPLRAANPGRPILFTEVGLVDDLGVPHDQASNIGRPVTGRDAGGISPGMRQQANMYTALLNVNAARGHPVQGMFFWSMYMLHDLDAGSATCDVVTHHILCSPPARDAVAAGYAAWAAADAQRVFDWAERSFAAFFPPGTGQNGSALGYTLRYYPATDTYLGARDGRIYVHNGRNWNLYDAGPLAEFLDMAVAAGL